MCYCVLNIFKRFFDSQDSGSPPHKIVENCKFELYIRRTTAPNFMKIGQTVAEISRFFGFSRWRPMVSIVVQNVVEIDDVVSIV